MSTALGLIEQVILTLESSPIFTTAFGDNYDQATMTGTAKVFADFADQVPLPYVVLTEPGESYDFMSASQGPPSGGWTNYVATGQMAAEIYASSRFEVRTLGFIIASALNDKPFYWAGINDQLTFRMLSSQFVPTTDPSGPIAPIMFRRIFVFEYVYSASLPLGSL